jgi:type IV pilus assembly protein PilM
MALPLPFLNSTARKKRSQIIGIDLGSRTTKAVLIERRGEVLALTRYALLDAPHSERKITTAQLSDHLRAVVDALGGSTKHIVASASMEDAIVRLIELPQIPVYEMRQILKVNHKNYLQQELPNHVFDCHIFPPRMLGAKDKSSAPGSGGVPKLKILAAAAKQQFVADFMQAASSAGLVAESLVPGLIGPANDFEQCQPEIFTKETIAIVDIGFKHSSVIVLDRGELVLNRMINVGGDKLTAGLAETMSISYAEAEGIKVGMAPEVESALQMQIMPLSREIRASLDFFEHQYDRTVSQIFVTGGSSRSEMIVQMMHSELMLECKTWDPVSFLQLALPGQQAVEVEHIGPQLTTALGIALAAL